MTDTFSIENCACGRQGRYMNMAHGDFVWTCGKYGCANPPKITTESTVTPKEKPDCRLCTRWHRFGNKCEDYLFPFPDKLPECVNGDQFKPSEPIYLYKVTE